MSLRKKTAAVTAVATASLVLVLYLVSQFFLMGSYTSLEEREVEINLQRAVGALNQRITSLDILGEDWASWDDTYEFVNDRNEDYVDSNLGDETFVNSELNVLAMIAPSGDYIYTQVFDLEEEVAVDDHGEVIEQILGAFSMEAILTEESRAGLVLLNDGPMLIAVQPILDSEGQGPARGAMIMGRYLDDALTEALGETTQLALTTYAVGDTNLPVDVEVAIASLAAGADTVVSPVDAAVISGYTFIEDINGEAVLAVRVDVPREIYAQGRQTMLTYIVALLVAGIVFGAVNASLMRRLVLAPLTRLSHNLRRIAESGNISQRLPVEGHDEVSSLALNVNNTLESLEHSRAALHQKETLLQEIHHRIKNNLQVVASLLRLQSRRIKDEEMTALFRDSEDRVKSIALIHEKLYRTEDFSQIEFGQYLRELASGLFSAYGVNQAKISLRFDMDEVYLSIDSATPCGLLMNELISNSLKHAFDGMDEGEVDITLRSNPDGSVTVAVRDSGVGYPEGLEFERGGSLGLELVRTLTAQLGGSIEYNSSPGAETRITFTDRARGKRTVSDVTS